MIRFRRVQIVRNPMIIGRNLVCPAPKVLQASSKSASRFPDELAHLLRLHGEQGHPLIQVVVQFTCDSFSLLLQGIDQQGLTLGRSVLSVIRVYAIIPEIGPQALLGGTTEDL